MITIAIKIIINIVIKLMTGNHELSFDPALRGLEQELSLSMGRCGHTGLKRRGVNLDDKGAHQSEKAVRKMCMLRHFFFLMSPPS